MFTNKDRKIANEQARVKNRDILINDLTQENAVLKSDIRKLTDEKELLEDLLKNISDLTCINTYNNEKVFLRKIKELVSDYQSQN